MKNVIALIAGLGLLSSAVYAQEINATTQTASTNAASGKKETTGDAFLAKNQKKTGVITLADGLQYKILKAGKGSKPSANDIVVVHYAGKLINGTEFDSSYKRGEPASFPVSGVIAGWTEALQLMPVGSTWELYIPSALAYGEQGAPPMIGPNEPLIFKVELLEIKK